MGAGQLRELVTFQRMSTGAGDGAGNYGEAFADLAGASNVAAALNPLNGSEIAVSEGIQGRAIYEVQIRYTAERAAIRVDDRMIDVRNPSRIFNVKSPPKNPDQRRKYLRLLVEIGGAPA